MRPTQTAATMSHVASVRDELEDSGAGDGDPGVPTTAT